MSFIWPWVLVALLALPVCVYLYVLLQRKRASDAASLGALGNVQEGAVNSVGRRRHIAPVIFLIAVGLLAMASARPQITLPVPRQEGVVVLTMDVSSSMVADDVEPTRMDAAKVAAKAIVDRRPASARIGIVAFGEGGLIVNPPTDDDQALYATIDRLEPSSGTSLGTGIQTALNLALSESGPGEANTADSDLEGPRSAFAPAVIVLLTDGENTEQPDPLEVAQLAIDRGVRVHTVGIGTADGAVIEVDGFNLFTQLNEPVLQEIALLTEGDYYGVEDVEDLSLVYEGLETEFVVEPTEVEVTSAFGGVGALLLLAGGVLSLFWFGRMP